MANERYPVCFLVREPAKPGVWGTWVKYSVRSSAAPELIKIYYKASYLSGDQVTGNRKAIAAEQEWREQDRKDEIKRRQQALDDQKARTAYMHEHIQVGDSVRALMTDASDSIGRGIVVEVKRPLAQIQFSNVSGDSFRWLKIDSLWVE